MSQYIREQLAMIRICANNIERELAQEEEAEQLQDQEEKHATFGGG